MQCERQDRQEPTVALVQVLQGPNQDLGIFGGHVLGLEVVPPQQASSTLCDGLTEGLQNGHGQFRGFDRLFLARGQGPQDVACMGFREGAGEVPGAAAGAKARFPDDG
jgi:hypothetical protein